MSEIGRFFLFLGFLFILLGVLFLYGGKFPKFGHLPGDILIHRDGFTFYFPLVTMLLLSFLLSILLNVFLHLFLRQR